MSDVVEQHTIRAIPGSARHGSARDLLPFWFTVNASVYMIGLGGFVAEFRLGLWPTIAAIVAGAAVGGAFMAAHSAQGPRLGVPQLVQSRAQFGFYGALLPNAAIWLLLLSTLVAADVTAGLAAEVPFADSLYPAFEGPVSAAWNGLDISWLVGFIVAGGLYYLASPHRQARRDAAVRLDRSV
jgi:purine-cytosine permease-like protein